jgi:hypothetical protein
VGMSRAVLGDRAVLAVMSRAVLEVLADPDPASLDPADPDPDPASLDLMDLGPPHQVDPHRAEPGLKARARAPLDLSLVQAHRGPIQADRARAPLGRTLPDPDQIQADPDPIRAHLARRTPLAELTAPAEPTTPADRTHLVGATHLAEGTHRAEVTRSDGDRPCHFPWRANASATRVSVTET